MINSYSNYAIQMLGRDREVFKMLAENYREAIEIFKGYGQYQEKKIYYIYDVHVEEFVDMVREDWYLITEF